MKKHIFISILFFTIVSFTAKADLVVDSLGNVRIGRGIMNVAELGLTTIANGQMSIANIDNANIDNANIDDANIDYVESTKVSTDTIRAQYANLNHVHFGQTRSNSAYIQSLSANVANISDITSTNISVDSASTNYLAISNTTGGIRILPTGIKNLQSNEALCFEKNQGMFFFDGQQFADFHNDRRPYAFSIGTSRPNLYLHNYNRGVNTATITAVVESNNSILFSGYNNVTNINSCQIKADGTFISRSGFITASDASIKDNIQSITNVLNDIRDINPVSYNLKTDISNAQQAQRSGNADNSSVRTRYGFIAQELEEIFPNVIYEMPDGEKGIAYQEIIPILVGAIQEQQLQIEALTEEIESLSLPATPQRQQAAASAQETIADDSAMLMQNSPNPFNQATEIGYRLPEGTATAMIMVCDMNGKMLQTYPLAVNATAGTLTIQAGSYAPGMYLYTLLVDGSQIDTKQMIILAH